MTDKLPPPLLALFAPRPPLRYLPSCDYAPEQRRTQTVTGVAAFLQELRRPDPDYVPTESWLQQKDRRLQDKRDAQEQKLKDAIETYHPENDSQIRGDPYKTLFASRMNYQVTETDLEREFSRFGPIERIRIIRNKAGKSRGYAFIVYEREQDMKAAYKETDGLRIKDRRVLVDVERGRTVKGWKPRRLGGGLGGRGYTRVQVVRPGSMGASGFGNRFGGDRDSGGRGSFRGRDRGGFGDRGGFRGGRGPRGGLGYRGSGGFGGDRGDRGDRDGHHGRPSSGGGFPSAPANVPATASANAPANAPTGPGRGRGGFQGSKGFQGPGGPAYGGERRGSGYDRRGGGGGYQSRDAPKDRGYGVQQTDYYEDRNSGAPGGVPGGPSGGAPSGPPRFGGDRDRDRRDDGRKRRYDDDGRGGDRHRRRY